MSEIPENIDIKPIEIGDFTTAVQLNSDVEGNGIFDVMMNSLRANVYEEYEEGRITGTEYATVYLQAMNAAGDRALQFLLSKDKAYLEAHNLNLQGELLEAQVGLAEAQTEIAIQELAIKTIEAENEAAKIELEMEILRQNSLLIPEQVIKVQEEIDLLQTQDLIAKQTHKSETAKANKATEMVAAELANMEEAVTKTQEEIDLLEQQELKVTEETSIAAQQLINQTAISVDATDRVAIEYKILQAQHCKLQEEFNVLVAQKNKIGADASLVGAKETTEAAQTSSTNIGTNSILDKQRALYTEQADAFKRDAEQKATKIMVDTWNVQKTVDPNGVGTSGYGLGEDNVSGAVNQLLKGIDVVPT